MDIIDKLIHIQNDLNLNQKELAKCLNISPQAINVMLKRKTKPSLDTITALCKMCYDNNISLEWLLLDINDTNALKSDEKRILNAYKAARPEIKESAILLLEAGKDKQEQSCDLKTG